MELIVVVASDHIAHIAHIAAVVQVDHSCKDCVEMIAAAAMVHVVPFVVDSVEAAVSAVEEVFFAAVANQVFAAEEFSAAAVVHFLFERGRLAVVEKLSVAAVVDSMTFVAAGPVVVAAVDSNAAVVLVEVRSFGSVFAVVDAAEGGNLLPH